MAEILANFSAQLVFILPFFPLIALFRHFLYFLYAAIIGYFVFGLLNFVLHPPSIRIVPLSHVSLGHLIICFLRLIFLHFQLHHLLLPLILIRPIHFKLILIFLINFRHLDFLNSANPAFGLDLLLISVIIVLAGCSNFLQDPYFVLDYYK